MYDPEAVYQDADIEQAQFEADGARLAADRRESERLAAEGNLVEAAEMCPHGGGYPLDSPAALNDGDPNAGEHGVRCSDCGSRLSAFAWEGGEVLVPCEWKR